MSEIKIASLFLMTLAFATSAFTWAAPSPPLKLTDFLQEVRAQNQAIRGSTEISEGSLQRSHEAELLLKPTLFARFQLANDSSLSSNMIQTDRVIANNYSLGVSQTTSFGLTARLSYSLNYTDLIGVTPQLAPLMPGTVFHDAKPSLELTQSLWRNHLGAETSATQEASHAAAMAASLAESFKIKLLLAEAEMTYWRLVMARQTVLISRENHERSVKLRNWAQNRLEKHLTDRSDLLQAEAALQARSLDLQSAIDEERAASRAFNSARGKDLDQVPDTLESLNAATLSSLPAPERFRFREDVLAAEQQSRAAQASSRLGAEKNKPTFEVFGSVSLNGRGSGLTPALSNSLSTERPTFAAGARLIAPLDWKALKSNQSGYAKEEAGAELTFRRKQFEQEREWQDLSARLKESRHRFELSKKLEKIQNEKLLLERERLNRGRSTTYQVLIFETDYALAQLGSIRAGADILKIIAQMRTFSGVSS